MLNCPQWTRRRYKFLSLREILTHMCNRNDLGQTKCEFRRHKTTHLST